MSYRTPPGTDETLVPLPPELEQYSDRISAHKYRNAVVLKGGKYTTEILDEIGERLNHNKGVVINITGPPGIGKTYFGMTFAQIYDNKFHIQDSPAPDPKKDDSQICFEREHIQNLVGDNSPLKRGQALLIDEAHFGMGSRSFQNKDQIDIVNLIAAIRSRGFLLIIVSLHSTMIDKIPREFVVNYEFATKDRGVAKTYFRWFPTFATKAHHKGKGTLELPLPDPYDPDTGLGCDFPDCLRCGYLNGKDPDRCYNIRAIYERRKSEFIGKMSNNENEAKKPKRTREERIQLVLDNKEYLFKNNRGLIEIGSLQKILALHEEPNGENTARSLKTDIEGNHPDFVKALPRKPVYS